METLITTLFTPMLDRAIEECKSVIHLKDDISNLKHSMILIRFVLQDAEKRQDTDDAIKQWLGQLDDIVFDARNVLDDFVLYTHSKRHKTHRHKINRFKLARKIKGINGRLEKVIKQKDILNLRPCEVTRTDQASRVETGYLPDAENLFVGRDEIKQSMLDEILANHADICQVRFIPIWGMGGIGKTTLAQSIYNDYSRITEKDYPRKSRKWICVGEKEFDAKRIMKEIVYESADYPSVATLQEYLVNKLNANGGGKFLIVLDDVWCIKRNQWEIIWSSLARVEKGGVVIMTTRLKDVIANTGNKVQEELPRLSHSDCWNIFKKRAFVGGDVSSRPQEFEEVGRKIVDKLNGLPLAVDVVGNSLLNEVGLETWRNFLDNKKLINLWEDIMPALKWSYDLLPSELKPCFAYCSLFPKDHMYKKEDLVNMWMAHDFIRSDYRTQRPEDVGSDYLKKLLNASLLQHSGHDSYVKMHDMIHDLAKIVSNDQYFMIDDHNEGLNRIPERARHLWIQKEMRTFDDLNHKRLLSFYKYEYKPVKHMPLSSIENFFIKLKFTRILVLCGYNISKIPDSIGKLKHIRYLDLEHCYGLESIPESISRLHFLQTLKLPPNCSFPRSLGNLIHLRHLIGVAASVNSGVGKLTSLQELSCIKIDVGENIGELQHLEDLHGTLAITGICNIQSLEDASNFNLQGKKHIRHLLFHFEDSTTAGNRNSFLEEGILNALQPPPLLEDFFINGYLGSKFLQLPECGLPSSLQRFILWDCLNLISLPSTISSLTSLVELGIHNCPQLVQLPECGLPSSLKSFKLRDCRNLVSLSSTISRLTSHIELEIDSCPQLLQFPECGLPSSLRIFNLSNFPNLVSLPSTISNLTSLVELGIFSCPQLLQLPECGLPSSLQRFTLCGCPYLEKRCERHVGMDWGKIEHIPDCDIGEK